jgi:DNA-binding NarL/FixJ family response regulator
MDRVITTATDSPVFTQLDWTRTLLTPLQKPAWRTYLYFVLISVLAVVGVVFIFCTGLASGLLIVTLVGIPLLALVVMSGRAWNRLYRSLARLTGVTIEAPPPFVRPPGRLQTVAATLTDAVGWRSLGFLALHAVLMTPIGYVVLVGVVMSGVLIVSPVVWAILGEPIVSLGEPVDSLWAYLLLSIGGVAALYLLGWVMLGLSRTHVWPLRRSHPDVGVLVFSQWVETRYATELLAGHPEGVGYLLKDRVTDIGEFDAAVRRVAAGGTALDPEVVRQLIGNRRTSDALDRLTPREREVLALMAEGHSNSGLAQHLSITERAIEKHVSAIFTKLDLPPSQAHHRRVLAVVAYLNS